MRQTDLATQSSRLGINTSACDASFHETAFAMTIAAGHPADSIADDHTLRCSVLVNRAIEEWVGCRTERTARTERTLVPLL
jgi:hypothetical protein